MIRCAALGDIPRLLELWKTCFSASDSELDFFFGRLFRAKNTWIYEEGGQILAMLYVLPYMIAYFGKSYPIHYFYGIGTDPQARGRGLAGALISHAKEKAREEGAPFCFLVPQSESLFSYYERFGFLPLVLRSLPTCEPIGFQRADYKDIPRLNQMYEHALLCRPHPIRTCEEWKILLDEMKEVLLGEEGYLVYNEKNMLVEGFSGAMRMGEAKRYASFCMLDPEFSLDNAYFNLLHD